MSFCPYFLHPWPSSLVVETSTLISEVFLHSNKVKVGKQESKKKGILRSIINAAFSKKWSIFTVHVYFVFCFELYFEPEPNLTGHRIPNFLMKNRFFFRKKWYPNQPFHMSWIPACDQSLGLMMVVISTPIESKMGGWNFELIGFEAYLQFV